MKKVIKQWLAFTLAIGAFVSCSEDRNEPSSTAEGGGETVTLSLSAEVSMDDTDLRAINYKLGTNANGAVVPLPQFTDGELVDVHTIVKSSYGEYDVKTLKWRYNATKRLLELAPSVKDSRGTEYLNELEIQDFNNDDDRKWYISGLIGGTLSGTKVTFEGKRELTGVEGNVGDAVGSLNVPYAFPWTEVVIDTSNSANTRDGNGSYKYAQVPSTSNLKFAPQGSLIAYKLGTNQRAGAYTFTPTGFTVSSNAFGDKGTFELNTTLPSNSTPTVLPAWTEGAPSALVYSFASGQEPGTIAHQQTADKVYYAWVMPHATQPASVVTRVTMKGDSSRPTTSTYRDYTKTWFTDYQVKASRLTNGHVHTLRANATHTYLLPIEYVTDYNLAGGEGLTETLPNNSYQHFEYNPSTGAYTSKIVPLPGTTGPLRFAGSHDNNVSGYYNSYLVRGDFHEVFNPNTKNLQAEIDQALGVDKYFIPSVDQWWGVFPAHNTSEGLSSLNDLRRERDEAIAFGPGHDLIRQSYISDYLYDNYSGGSYFEDNHILYAIRFKGRNNSTPMTMQADYDASTNQPITYTYPSATDNSLKCAYRYTFVGGPYSWYLGKESNSFIIDVVYLGEEAVPTTVDDISNSAWWDTKRSEGLVITKTFPLSSAIWQTPNDKSIANGSTGSNVSYQSSSMKKGLGSVASVGAGVSEMAGFHEYSFETKYLSDDSSNYFPGHYYFPTVRLFQRRPY